MSNIADLSTGHAEVSKISEKTEWQNGKPWMYLSHDEMPLKSIEKIYLSAEEKRNAVLETKNSIMNSDLPDLIPRVFKRYNFCNNVYDPNKCSWVSSAGVVSCVFSFISNCKPGLSPSRFPPPPPVFPITRVPLSP